MNPWTSNRLSRGQGMITSQRQCQLSIDHVDRVIDPYLACVIHQGLIVYTGLHRTLADARQTAERKAHEST